MNLPENMWIIYALLLAISILWGWVAFIKNRYIKLEKISKMSNVDIYKKYKALLKAHITSTKMLEKYNKKFWKINTKKLRKEILFLEKYFAEIIYELQEKEILQHLSKIIRNKE